MSFVCGCSATPPELVTVYETVTLYRDRYVEFDSWITKDCEFLEPSEAFDLEELGAVHIANRVRNRECNHRWGEVRRIQGTMAQESEEDQ